MAAAGAGDIQRALRRDCLSLDLTRTPAAYYAAGSRRDPAADPDPAAHDHWKTGYGEIV